MGWFRKLALQSILLSRHSSESATIRDNRKQLHLSEKLNQESLHNQQIEQLTRLLLHAYRHVPYFTQVLRDSGVVDGKEHVDIARFDQIPLLDKDAIRCSFSELKSDDLNQRQWRYNTSGGSTGEPVRLIQDGYLDTWRFALKVHYDGWTGHFPGDRQVRLWGSERDLLVGKETKKTQLLRWLNNETWLNAFKMTRQQMQDYVDQINKVRPVQILAYVGSLYELSRFIKHEGLKVYSPKSVMTTAGTLHPHMRQLIKEVFGAPIFNRYGSREVGDIACECERHSGLHVSFLTHYVEILRQNGEPVAPGEVGEVVVTSLVNYAMPLIRYRIGDLAAWAETPCGCGRSWPLLKEVTGRVSDSFLTSAGAQVHGEYFTHLFYFRDWVEKFQVIQEDWDDIHVVVVPRIKGEDLEQKLTDEIGDIAQKIKLVMGEQCSVKVQFVEDILPSSSGKFRYTISRVTAADPTGS